MFQIMSKDQQCRRKEGKQMIGAIIGDIVGSRFEFNNYRSKEFELFTKECRVTDDSIMTLAVAKALIEAGRFTQSANNGAGFERDEKLENMAITYMQELGRKYPNCGFGGMFSKWIFSRNPQPYNSFGNGSAMRISPVGFLASTESEARALSQIVTRTTHNHEEGVKGAEATVVAIFMARNGFTKDEIRTRINRDYYQLNFTIDEIRETYRFDATCQGTVPQAIVAFLESNSFEDAIRTAISIGGDSDTLAAITGSIAEAYYGVPESIIQKALTYLDVELRKIYDQWCQFTKQEYSPRKFKVLTKYIRSFDNADSFGEWVIDQENDGTMENPVHMPYVNYDELVGSFTKEFYLFVENHPEYELSNYNAILEDNGLSWNSEAMRNAEVDHLNEQCILALILGIIRADRFCEGTLLSFIEDGYILKWLKRLKSIED